VVALVEYGLRIKRGAQNLTECLAKTIEVKGDGGP